MSNSILLHPLSQEQPPGGYAILKTPRPGPECAEIARIWAGTLKDYILVTRVFHGMQKSQAVLDASGNLSADIEQKKIQAILGATPRANVQVSGSVLTMQYSKTPDEQSLAVQSAVINTREFARIYLRTRTVGDIRLEALVTEYLTGIEPGLLTKIRIAIEELLKAMEVRQASAAALYQSVFSGQGVADAATANIPQAHWHAFATVAAAHEIVRQRQ